MNLPKGTASAFAILYTSPGLLEFAVGNNRTFSLPAGKNKEMLLQSFAKDIPECGFSFYAAFPSCFVLFTKMQCICLVLPKHW